MLKVDSYGTNDGINWKTVSLWESSFEFNVQEIKISEIMQNFVVQHGY